jgi:histidine triad (HIT) family protein
MLREASAERESVHMDCLFCKIINREIPAKIVYEDDRVLAFNDINPQAPTHVLVVPKRHIGTLSDLTPEDDGIVGEVVRRGAAIADERGIAAAGFRAVFNTNKEAGQTVFHIHLHVIGGRPMHWPPG